MTSPFFDRVIKRVNEADCRNDGKNMHRMDNLRTSEEGSVNLNLKIV